MAHARAHRKKVPMPPRQKIPSQESDRSDPSERARSASPQQAGTSDRDTGVNPLIKHSSAFRSGSSEKASESMADSSAGNKMTAQ